MPGGWSFTSYSNREPFAIGAAQGFAGAFEGQRMENLGTFPGNARNRMIETYGDRGFIEAGHVAYLQSHGNIYGPDLEYLPISPRFTSNYQWGERGKLQWVIIGGCDVLGFTVFPNGEMAPAHPSPTRWANTFQGISGILGYRSGSWYQPNNANLGAQGSIVFVQELARGKTFGAAWISSADFIHRAIGQQAEVAVYASSTQALNDTLNHFASERHRGIEPKSIRRATVGRGPPPTYHYCERVDYDGNYLCDYLEKTDNSRLGSLSLAEKLDDQTLSLPIFRVDLEEPDEKFSSLIKATDENSYSLKLSDTHDSILTSMRLTGGQSDEFRQLVSASDVSGTLNDLWHEPRETVFDRSYSAMQMERTVTIGDTVYRILGDYGATVRADAEFTDVMISSSIHLREEVGTRKIAVNTRQIFHRLRDYIDGPEPAILRRLESVYRITNEGGAPHLDPTLAAYLIVGQGCHRRLVLEYL